MRTTLLLTAAVCAAATASPAAVSVVERPPVEGSAALYVFNRAPLAPNPLVKLPIGAIAPKGWLKGQLDLMAEGTTGRLDEDNLSRWVTKDSGWWDGTSKGWEEVPYWLKGLGDLGYVLGDQRIKAKAMAWLDRILESQQEDGYFGPPENKQNHDLWPNMVVLFALQSLYEATGDERVIPFMADYFRYEAAVPREELLHGSWQKVRGGDNLESIYWLYNRTGEPWLLDVARTIHERTADWTSAIASYHGVNFAQCFREPAVFYQQARDSKYLDATERNYDQMMAEYGQFPGGMVAADENCRPGKTGAEQAAETCAMVEFMYSNESLLRITGDPKYADRCEEIAFNSLPAAMTPDLKGLHYLTGANQVMCDRGGEHCYQNGGMMVAYSPGPAYRCCQHNVGHGWPYYAEHLWMATKGGGLAAVLYAACEVKAKVAGRTEVKIVEETDYPFGEEVSFGLSLAKPTQFPLMLRIPRWCEKASVAVNGQRLAVDAKPLSYVVIDRRWTDGDKVKLALPMDIRVNRWEKQNDGVSVSRGPLSYSLKIGEQWVNFGRADKWPSRELLPTTPWNYALVLDDKDPARSLNISRKAPVASQPFTPEAAPITLTASARRVPEWQLVQNCPAPVPSSPVASTKPIEQVELIPMGCARLRITVFPVGRE